MFSPVVYILISYFLYIEFSWVVAVVFEIFFVLVWWCVYDSCPLGIFVSIERWLHKHTNCKAGRRKNHFNSNICYLNKHESFAAHAHRTHKSTSKIRSVGQAKKKKKKSYNTNIIMCIMVCVCVFFCKLSQSFRSIGVNLIKKVRRRIQV